MTTTSPKTQAVIRMINTTMPGMLMAMACAAIEDEGNPMEQKKPTADAAPPPPPPEPNRKGRRTEAARERKATAKNTKWWRNKRG